MGGVSQGLYTLLQLLLSQVEGARRLAQDPLLSNAIFLSEVLWDPSPAASPSPPGGEMLSEAALLQDMMDQALAELKVVNTRNLIRCLCIKYTSSSSSSSATDLVQDAVAGKVYAKLVGGSTADYQASRQAVWPGRSLTTPLTVDQVQQVTLHGLVDRRLLPSPAPPLSLDNTYVSPPSLY